ncbi:MAG: hypothetical protein A3C35_07185 [Omnitrophica bacterium RIFCSPHIGHO2_02_FULL_46_11]|nr:MAG: hypothetical protein A3A81_00785 [Omnitrophica bacterium RIFCSPLOWO2_01_FULL_45_10b]OGW85943.1 MAG: hypothetical protein A3C35_07185 [Omnitrophica bacterium RIFCSPHIGHO2_02_FULL_46_11]
MPPKVSVLIPAYNMASYLSEAIESVFRQTFKDFELIVIDDGSTDNTREIVSRFKNHRIDYYYQDNQGRAAARNTGLHLAKGQYVAFLDADDVWNPDRLDRGVAALDSTPELGLVHGEVEVIDEKGTQDLKRTAQIRKYYQAERKKGSGHLRLLDKCAIFSSAILLRREYAVQVGDYDTAFPIYEDYDWYLRFSFCYPIGLINGPPIAKHRLHSENSFSGFDSKQHAEIYIRILEKQLAQVWKSEAGSAGKRRSLILKKLVEFYWRTGDKDQVRVKLLEAVRLNPMLAFDLRSIWRLIFSL